MTARGVTGADTLAGETTAELTVRKSFFVDLKVPQSLTEGDQPRFAARVHHVGARGKLTLRLATYAGGRDDVYPKTLELGADGVDEVLFDPFTVPETDTIRLTLTGTLGELSDEITVELPVRPWGVPVFASESGTQSESTTLFVGLPAGRNYESPEMTIVLSPAVPRMVVELALGSDGYPIRHAKERLESLPMPVVPRTTADRAADLLAATAALQSLRAGHGSPAPEAERLTRKIQGLASSLVAAQNADGGWPWVACEPLPRQGQQQPAAPASDPLTSATVVWALSSAEPLGLLTDPKVLNQGVGYLSQQYSQRNASDRETRAALLHALSTRHAASFEAANSLNRERTDLSDLSLAYLALTFANLDRPSLAGEVLSILGPRAKTEKAAPGHRPRLYWTNAGQCSFSGGPVEVTALVACAYARVQPQADPLEGAVAWLLAHRMGAAGCRTRPVDRRWLRWRRISVAVRAPMIATAWL